MMYKKILCPVDGSETSNRGMQEAIKLASDQHAKLMFIHVVDAYFPIIDGVGNFIPVDIKEVLNENAQAVIAEAKKLQKALALKRSQRCWIASGAGLQPA